VFKWLRNIVFKIEENRDLHKEIGRLNERTEKLRLALSHFAEMNKWKEEYPFDEPMFIRWIGRNKPWLRAEEAMLRDLIDSGEELPRDEIRVGNIVRELDLYEEVQYEEGRHSDGRELAGEIHPWDFEVD